jgi:hypothetical protein
MSHLYFDAQHLIKREPELLHLFAFPEVNFLFNDVEKKLIHYYSGLEDTFYLSLFTTIYNSITNKKSFPQLTIFFSFEEKTYPLNVATQIIQ